MSEAQRQIGPFRVLSTLQTSTESRVLLAQREGGERLFALKVFRSDLDPHLVKRYEQGVRLAAKISHPYVVRPLEVGRTSEGSLFVALEHIPGEDLRACLNRQKTFPWREAANLVADAAEGVDAAHRAGIVHRDLNPETVILNRRTHRAMVLDFGLARDTLAPTGLTDSGELIGGLVYMAPEQLAGEKAEAPADVYALGALLYELISGELPYLGRDLEELRQKVLAGERLDLRRRVPEVPRELGEVLDRALDIDPRRRPSAKVFSQALRDLGSVETAIPTAVLHARARGLSPAKVGASFGLWLLVLGGVSVWALTAHSARREADRRAQTLRVELELETERSAKAERDRARALERLNEAGVALTRSRERTRRAEDTITEVEALLARARRAQAVDRTQIADLRLALSSAARRAAPPRSAPKRRGKSAGLERTRSVRALLDWVADELKDVPAGLELRATILHNRGRYADALKALDRQDLPVSLRVLRARTLYKLKRIPEAIAVFRRVAKEDPESPHGAFCRALTTGDETLKLLREAAQRGPKLAYVRIMLSSTLLGAGAQRREEKPVREALEVIERAIELEPTSYQAHESHAKALIVLSRMTRDDALLEQALEAYSTAHRFNPIPSLRLDRAEVLRSLQRPAEALSEGRAALQEADLAGPPLDRVQLRLRFASLAIGLGARPAGVRALQEAALVDEKLLPQVRTVFERLPAKLRQEVVEGLPAGVRANLGG
ncbi:MAG: protein kinase [Planctomycetes bacterium]|nr:protein kinase [Planctomycetota bacterium]